MATQSIPTGVYAIEAPCPRCGQIELVLAGISSTLTTPQDGIPSLRVKLKGKAVDHDCQQTRITGGGG